ncbi:DUF5984 family protein [Flagellimonas hadalis]|nr:DUF5984 family protein [Allomuricauda hadalis]
MAMINFKLKELDKISPWGQEPELSLHWFGLTDGDLWLTFGNETIYEYTKEAIDLWGNQSPYNDYPLSRFIEDFTELFDKIREPIPEAFYNLSTDLKKFQSRTKKWLDKHYTDKDNGNDFYFDVYDTLISWVHARTLSSSHLNYGPQLSFFRYNNKVRVVWDTEHRLKNGTPVWTAKSGSVEMEYTGFVQKIKSFGQSFFAEMGEQIRLAVEKDWGKVELDKQWLVEEHEGRIDEFYFSLALLEQEAEYRTDWAGIKKLFDRMTNEI